LKPKPLTTTNVPSEKELIKMKSNPERKWDDVRHPVDDDVWHQVDDDEALSEDDFHHDLDPYGEEDPDWDPPLQDAHGLTADGYDLLAEMDAMRDFI
jgi:hypothetical protein